MTTNPIEPPERRVAPAAEEAGREALTDALQVSFKVLRWMMIVLVLIYLASGFFLVKQHESAVVLSFGKVQGIGDDRVKGPGPHWTWPRPFSEPVKVETERVTTLISDTFWFNMGGLDPSIPQAQLPPPPSTLNPARDGYTVTADANLLHTQWALRYTVADVERYRFGFLDIDTLLHHELDHAVVRTSARFSVDRALRTDIDAFRGEVERLVRQRADQQDLGIDVQGVEILSLYPPRQVADAFALVIQTEQEQGTAMSQARNEANTTLDEAMGEAARIRSEGEADRQQYISSVQASADYFEKVREKYQANPFVVSTTLLQDTIRRTLASVDAKYVLPKKEEGQEREVRLLVSPEQKSLFTEK